MSAATPPLPHLRTSEQRWYEQVVQRLRRAGRSGEEWEAWTEADHGAVIYMGRGREVRLGTYDGAFLDADLLANAPSDLRHALDIIETLRAERDEARATLAQIRHLLTKAAPLQ